MRWEPTPYVLKGWELQFDKDRATALPKMPELQEKISEAAEKLTAAIAEAENTLMLRLLSDTTLENLAKLCRSELKERKQIRAKFKLCPDTSQPKETK